MRSRVLIVDDEDNVRRSLAIGLRLQSYEVTEACDGDEALRFFEEGGEVDCAVIDLMMPGISGLDLARELRARCPQVRVVLTSAYHLTERQLERADLGVVGFVPKPFHLEELVEFIDKKCSVPPRAP